MSKKPKTYGRNPSRRYFVREAKKRGLEIVYRRGRVWYFRKSGLCNVVCLRYATFLMKNLNPVLLRWQTEVKV